MTNLDRVLKSSDINLLTKISVIKAMLFPVVMYGCELDHKEGWAPKNWCFSTVVLEKALESPLDSREIQVNPKGNQPWIFIEGLMLKLTLQYFGQLSEEPTHWQSPWCWERLKAKGEGRSREWDGYLASPTQWTWIWANCGRQWRTRKPGVLQFTGSQRVEHDLVTEQQQRRCVHTHKHTTFSLSIPVVDRVKLLPHLGYCESCCNEHGNIDTSWRYWFHFFRIYRYKWDCWIKW